MYLKTKFFLAFLAISLIPLALAITLGYYSTKIINLTSSQTKQYFEKTGEASIEEKTKANEKIIKLYLEMKKIGLEEEIGCIECRSDPMFFQSAIQMVGKAGYSFLLMEQENNITIFLHPNPKLIGIELEVMAKDNPQLLNIFKTQRQGNDLLKGYYSWKDPGGREEKKFIVILPISNTPLMVATTIDAKEIETLPTEFEKDLLLTKKRFMGGLLIGGIISVAIIVLVGVLFARHWSKPFLELTKVAERIAVGELDATIKITSKDEIGDLADVLRRIQISLKKAIQRLQKNTP